MAEAHVHGRYRWYNGIVLNAYFLGVSFMWNSLHPILLPLLVLSFAPEHAKNTAYGLLTFLGLVVALVVQPVSGALSDHTASRLGRRRPWLILGTMLNIGCLIILTLAGNYWMIAAGYILLQFSSNLAHGPAQALIPDLVPEGGRGYAAGMKNLLEMLGVILAALVASRVLDRASAQRATSAIVIGAMLLLSMAITVLGVREWPSDSPVRPKAWGPSVLARIKELFDVDVHGQRDYARLLLARYCILLGTFSVQSFGLYYFRDALDVEASPRVVAGLMTVIALSITVVAYPAGILSERWGRKALCAAACALTAAGMAALLVTRSAIGLWLLGCLIGLGMGIFSSVSWAWATDLVPTTEAGKYLGLSNLATAGSAATSRLLGPLIDVVNASTLTGGYSLLFMLATLGALVSLWVILRVPEGRVPLERIKRAFPSPQANSLPGIERTDRHRG